jgi:hypothetical protein
MAKRKRQRGGGSKLQLPKDYRDDHYVPYIIQAETGILEAWAIAPALNDGEVRQTLRQLIRQIDRSGQLPPELQDVAAEGEEISVEADEQNILPIFILKGLRHAFREHGALPPEDVVGILKVINYSIGTWNEGMRRQGYLTYLKGFLGNMSVGVRRLTQSEAEELGLDELE